MNNPTERVPVQVSPELEHLIKGRKNPTIERRYAEAAYIEYAARYGTQQSFDRIHERGGFGIEEIMMLLCWRIERLEAKK